MKRTAVMSVILAAASLAVAQTAQQPQPPNKSSQQPSAPGAAQSGTPTPTGKLPPQAKTQAEFDAYQAALKSANDPAAIEKAADDFAAKFPDSELRVLLYRVAMHAEQSANNAEKMSETAQKILKIDPDDPEALIGAAEVIAERTRDTDLDKDQRYAEAQKDAQRALQTIDTDAAIPAGTPQERIDAYKGFLRSSAYSILGTIAFNQKNYAQAEEQFRKSIDAYPAQPDPVVVLRLAIALDNQGKYPDALKEANRAVDLTQENTTAGTLARRERDRLVQLTGGSPAPGPKPSSGAMQNPNPSPH
ncbi:MAG TPA: tetratricopeptide repeat protein [Terriglobales bacterium]|nr:tetratricopeptide repeat protein [Terriglobales bacterium]